jgi:hypothetical protein
MKLYQKKVQPAYFSCQEMDDILLGAGGGGGGRKVRKEIANGPYFLKRLWSPGIDSKE